MQIVNSSTNAIVAGIQFPQGVFQLPIHGNITVLCEQGYTTNIPVGNADTLAVNRNGVDLMPGYDLWLAFIAGLVLSVSVFGVGIWANFIWRWMHRFLGNGQL